MNTTSIDAQSVGTNQDHDAVEVLANALEQAWALNLSPAMRDTISLHTGALTSALRALPEVGR